MWLLGQINNKMKLLFILASLVAASHQVTIGAPSPAATISPGQKVSIGIADLPSNPVVSHAQYYIFIFCSD